jgi:hypothetical protein
MLNLMRWSPTLSRSTEVATSGWNRWYASRQAGFTCAAAQRITLILFSKETRGVDDADDNLDEHVEYEQVTALARSEALAR